MRSYDRYASYCARGGGAYFVGDDLGDEQGVRQEVGKFGRRALIDTNSQHLLQQ
jgi:hypothetical protein